MTGIIFIHGVNEHEIGYSDDLFKHIGKGVQNEVIWSDITRPYTDGYMNLHKEHNGKWGKVSEVVKPLVGQVLFYVQDKKKDMRILQRVNSQVKMCLHRFDDIVIVAHSLGAVIAFDYLFGFKQYKLPDTVNVRAFVTMGAPIGLFTSSMGYAESSLELPLNVKKWVNLIDYDDQIADTLEPHFDCVQDIEVNTGFFAIQAHGGYWRSKKCGQIISDLI